MVCFLVADSLGPRKRKKRVRFGEEDSDQENQPPQGMPRTEGESIIAKVEAELCAPPLGVFGSDLLLDPDLCPTTQDLEAEPAPVEETRVGFASLSGESSCCRTDTCMYWPLLLLRALKDCRTMLWPRWKLGIALLAWAVLGS